MLKTIFRTFLLGFGVGILVAPRPGRETREMLSEKFNQLFNSEGGSASTQEWDRPLSDNVNAGVTSNQHYATSSVGTSSPALGDVSASDAASTEAGTAGATDI